MVVFCAPSGYRPDQIGATEVCMWTGVTVVAPHSMQRNGLHTTILPGISSVRRAGTVGST